MLNNFMNKFHRIIVFLAKFTSSHNTYGSQMNFPLCIESSSFVNHNFCVNLWTLPKRRLYVEIGSWNCLTWWNYIIWFHFCWKCFIFWCFLWKINRFHTFFHSYETVSYILMKPIDFFIKNTNIWNTFNKNAII